MSTDSDLAAKLDSIVLSGDEDDTSYAEQAKEAVDKLYAFRDTYFLSKIINEASANQKVTDVKEKLDETLQKLESFQWNRKEKAVYHLYVGKALNVVSEYDVKCQEQLSKAIKLNPRLSEAWYQLGECHWKNNDIDGAYNCFKSALEYHSDKHILRAMSMVIRQVPSLSAEERKNRFSESIAKAKEALKLDMGDGRSWAALGTAYLNSFLFYPFSSKSMSRALAAYHKATQDPVAASEPDLHYNYGIALQYESSFQQCLEQWGLASCLDSQWQFPKEAVNQTVTFLDNLLVSIGSRGKMKEKRFKQLLASLKDPKTRDRELGPYLAGRNGTTVELQAVPFSQLKEGLNSNMMVLAKVICGVVQGDQLAYTIIVTDELGCLLPLRVFNLGQGKGPVIGDSVVVPEPYVERISVAAETVAALCREAQVLPSALSQQLLQGGVDLRAIRVSLPSVLVVNGRKINNQWTALPVVHNLYFTENWLSSSTK